MAVAHPALMLTLAASLTFAPACETVTSRHGSSRVLAAYRLGTLEADLPDHVRIPAVLAAAEASLRHRGYAVEHSTVTADRGRVLGASPNRSLVGDDAEVTARVGAFGTRVGIMVGTVGNESRSRAILDDILTRLSL